MIEIRNHDAKKFNKGFTLMEMLIVVAIIAVLIAVAIPVFSSQLSKANLSVCLANRRGLLAQLTYTQLLDELDETKANEILADYGTICPAGGSISVSLNDGIISISCSVHNDEGEGIAGSASGDYLDRFSQLSQAAAGKDKNNDLLREAFFAANGNKWPTLTLGSKDYQIEPYYSPSGDCWLFARPVSPGTDTVLRNWSVPLVYNPNDGCWYEYRKNSNDKQNSVSVNYSNLQALQDKIDNPTGDSAWHKLAADEYATVGLS